MPYERPYNPTEKERKERVVEKLGDRAADAYALQTEHVMAKQPFLMLSGTLDALDTVAPSISPEEAFNEVRAVILKLAEIHE